MPSLSRVTSFLLICACCDALRDARIYGHGVFRVVRSDGHGVFRVVRSDGHGACHASRLDEIIYGRG